jgi:hypothetical protein
MFLFCRYVVGFFYIGSPQKAEYREGTASR